MKINKKEVEAFVSETDEIVDNLKGIKGEIYTNGLLIILNVINVNKVIEDVFGSRATAEEVTRIGTLTNCVINDTIMRVASLLCPSAEGEAYKTLCKDLSRDCRILVDKQEEYSVKERL